MTLTGWEGVLFGVIGGVLGEIPGFFQLKKEWQGDHHKRPEWPEYLKAKKYWLITSGLILAGGGWVALAMTEIDIASRLLAVNLGASAPLAIESIFRPTLPVPSMGRTD